MKFKGNTASQVVKVFSIFFGTVIGAGFASGREIYVYFARFGIYGLVMSILVGLYFFYLGYIFLQLGSKTKANTISDFLKAIFGKFDKIAEIIIIFSYIIVLSAMFAGFDSLQKILFSNQKLFPFIAIISAVLCSFVVLGGLKNISKINFAIIPLLVIFMFTIFFFALINCEQNLDYLYEFDVSFTIPLFCSFIFICSNMFLTGFILLKTGNETNKKVNLIASFLTGFIIGLLEFLACLAILKNPTCIQYDMPFMFLAQKISDGFVLLSVIILWFAIFTTAVATLYTVSWWLNSYIKDRYICSCVTCFVSFALSRVGFSAIIGILYPLTGFMDVLFVVFSLIYYYKLEYNNKIKKFYNYHLRHDKKLKFLENDLKIKE